MKDTAWAIAGRLGLYTGTAPTRRDVIAQHVWAYDETLYAAGWPSLQGRALSERQRDAWAKCRQRGDRAVKVRIETIGQ